MKRLLFAALSIPLMACGSSLLTTSVVLDTDSSAYNSTTAQIQTSSFVVSGAWNLKYTWDCTRQASEGKTNLDHFDMNVMNADDLTTSFENPETHRIGRKGRGTLQFTRAGDFFLTIKTVCDWTAQAVELGAGQTASGARTTQHLAVQHGKKTLDVTFQDSFVPTPCPSGAPASTNCLANTAAADSSPFGALEMDSLGVYTTSKSSDCSPATGTGTITDPDGDTLSVAWSGIFCRAKITGHFIFQVTGGTGSLAGASGAGSVDMAAGGRTEHWNGSINFA